MSSNHTHDGPGTVAPDASLVLVSALMSHPPVLIDARSQAHAAERVAHASGVHHLLVVEANALVRVVCLCDLELAPQCEPVGGLGRASVVFVNGSTRASAAARMMLECGVGCLPVLDTGGAVVGIVTRRDLRRAGALPGERGVDLCAACGSGHHLRTRGLDGTAFCVPCLAGTPTAGSVDSIYLTLGGSG